MQLLEPEQDAFLRRACRARRNEDFEDIYQEARLLIWEAYLKSGKVSSHYFGPLGMFAMAARTRHLRKQLGRDWRRRFGELPDDWETDFSISFADTLDLNRPDNPLDAIGGIKFKFVSDCKKSFYLTYREISEYFDCTSSSVGRMRRLGRPLKIFKVGDKIYPSLKVIQRTFGWTQARARHRSEKYTFRWDLKSASQILGGPGG